MVEPRSPQVCYKGAGDLKFEIHTIQGESNMKHTLFLMVWVATLLAIPLAVSSAEPTGKPAAIMADAAVAVATVVAVDQDSRTVTLKGPDGDELEYTAGPEVRDSFLPRSLPMAAFSSEVVRISVTFSLC